MSTYKTKTTFATLITIATLLCALLIATPAHALEVRKLTGTFGETTFGANGGNFGEGFYEPAGLAIDQATGNVYVEALRP